MYEPTRIRAARIIGEPATKLYNNYLRLGMGNYWSPLADLYWSSTRDRLKTYGIRINHRSSWDKLAKLPQYGPVQQGNTGVTLFGKYILADRLQLHSDLSYEHDHNLLYGFTDSTLQSVLGQTRDDISLAYYRASYNVCTWTIGIKNMVFDANKVGYAVDVHLSDPSERAQPPPRWRGPLRLQHRQPLQRHRLPPRRVGRLPLSLFPRPPPPG